MRELKSHDHRRVQLVPAARVDYAIAEGPDIKLDAPAADVVRQKVGVDGVSALVVYFPRRFSQKADINTTPRL